MHPNNLSKTGCSQSPFFRHSRPHFREGKLQQESRLVPRIEYGAGSVKAGNYEEIGSRFHGKPWIPPYQVRGRLSQARND